MNRNIKVHQYKKTEIGLIPEDWEVVAVRDIGDISTSSVNKKSCPDEKEVNIVNYMDVYNNLHRVINSKIRFMKVTAKDKQIESSNIKKGDILFTPTSETKDDIGISAVVTENLQNTLFSYHLLRLRFDKEIDLNFKRYMFNNPVVLRQFSKIAQGATRFVLTREDFLKVKLPLPPKDQQVKIASILQEVDNTIGKTDKIISEVEKIKKGFLERFFSNKGNKQKESKLKDVVSRLIVPMRDKPKRFEGNIPWCRIEDFDGKFLSKSKSGKFVDDNIIKEWGLKIFPKGTVICSCSAKLGVCAIADKELVTNQTFIGLVADKSKINNEFLYYLMSYYAPRLQSQANGTTIAYLSREKFEKFKIVLPNLEEQYRTVVILNSIDERDVKEKQKKKQLLKTKNSLMQKLLTGQVRVEVD